MAKTGLIVTGIILLVLAGLGFVTPVTDTGFTIAGVNNLCQSGYGQLGQLFSGDLQQICGQFQLMMYGIMGGGLIGIILLIVGLVVPSKSGGKTLTCSYCNFVAMSEAELLKHGSDKHLDKSPFVCEHCDFIGFTEEILWNHYSNEHPDKKKWKWN